MDLGPLEMRVLGLLDAEEASSVAEVRARLEARGHEVAYTTVLTVLSRLHDKGVVRRAKRGRKLVYWSSSRAGKVKTGIVSRIQRALFDNDRLRPIVALLDQERLSQDELRELRTLLDERIDGDKTR